MLGIVEPNRQKKGKGAGERKSQRARADPVAQQPGSSSSTTDVVMGEGASDTAGDQKEIDPPGAAVM